MRIGLYAGDDRGGIYNACLYLSKYTEAEMIENASDVEKYDIVHIHWMYPPLIKRPFIQTFHDILPFRYANTVKKKFGTALAYARHMMTLHRAVGVATDSEFSQRLCNRLFGIKPEVIRLGVDTRLFKPRKKSDYVCCCAALDYHKNVGVVLDAMRMSRDNIKLKLTGDGAMREELESKARRLGLDAEFFGWVDYRDVAKVMGKARALIQPELWAGFGLQILEAYACKTPVIASDIAAHREFPYNGYFSPASPAGLLRVLGNVLNKTPAEEIRKAYAYSGKFDWKFIGNNYQALYDNVKRILGDRC